jgi:hypothetical protein
MPDDFFDAIPKERTLDYKDVKVPLNNLMLSFINKIEREFPYADIGGAKLIFRRLAYIAQNTHNSIVFLCAELPKDPFRKIEYSLSAMPLLRILLEEIFTLVFISEDFPNKIQWYNQGGWREMKEEYDRLSSRYGKEQNWVEWLENYKNKYIEPTRNLYGIPEDPTPQLKYWPIPSRMIKIIDNPELKKFLQYLDDWFYKQSSQVAHLSLNGLIRMGEGLIPDHGDIREPILKHIRSVCMFQNITLLLAVLTEMEYILKFGLKERLLLPWKMVELWPEAKELYDKRYQGILC